MPETIDLFVARVYDKCMAKFDSNRKLERNQLLYEHYLRHPELSLAEIGRAFNITRQRVSILISLEKKRRATIDTVAQPL